MLRLDTLEIILDEILDHNPAEFPYLLCNIYSQAPQKTMKTVSNRIIENIGELAIKEEEIEKEENETDAKIIKDNFKKVMCLKKDHEALEESMQTLLDFLKPLPKKPILIENHNFSPREKKILDKYIVHLKN